MAFAVEILRRSSKISSWFQFQRPRLRRTAVTLHTLRRIFGHEERRLSRSLRDVDSGIGTAPNGPRSGEFARGFALHRGGESRLFFAEEAGAIWLRASVASFARRSAFSRAVRSMIARLAAS